MTLVLAVVAASIFALFARPFSDYTFWFSWSRPAFLAGVAAYFLIAGVGGGLLGWVLGAVSHAVPTTWPLVNGAIFGLVGALAIRVELKKAQTTPGRSGSSTPEQLVPAVTLLNTGINWTFDMLDDLVARRMETWLKDLKDDELCKVGEDVAERIEAMSSIDHAAKQTLFAKLVPTMEALAAANTEDVKKEPRWRLRAFAKKMYEEYRWPHPILGP